MQIVFMCGILWRPTTPLQSAQVDLAFPVTWMTPEIISNETGNDINHNLIVDPVYFVHNLT